MKRTKRTHIPGREAHVIFNAYDGGLLFRDDEDKNVFAKIVKLERESSDIAIHSAGLMDTHGHLATVAGIERSISSFTHDVFGNYASYYNRKHGHLGHVLREPHTRIDVQTIVYRLNLFRYILLNPFAAGLVSSLTQLEHYPWTGYPELLGHREPRLVSVGEALARFGDTADDARARIRAWMSAGAADRRWFEELEARLRRIPGVGFDLDPREIDRRFPGIVDEVARAMSSTSEELRTARSSDGRAAVIFLAVHRLGMTQFDSARRLGMGPARASELYPRGEGLAREMGLLPAPTELLAGARELGLIPGNVAEHEIPDAAPLIVSVSFSGSP